MKKALLTLAGFLLATTVQAQTCKNTIVKTKPDSQYELLNNDTEVKDKKTGLIWQRCVLGKSWSVNTCSGTATTHKWEEALAQAATVASNTNVAWRLPNLKELKSLVETACTGQTINETIFPATPNDLWTSSAYANGTSHAWNVNFRFGNDDLKSKSLALAVRLVRSQ